MDKKTGYALLWGGVGIILYSLTMASKVFVGGLPPPALIDLKTLSIPMPNLPVALPQDPQLPGGLAPAAESGPRMLSIPLDPQLSKGANLSLYVVFLFFVAGAGKKIADLGVKLINPAQPEGKKAQA